MKLFRIYKLLKASTGVRGILNSYCWFLTCSKCLPMDPKETGHWTACYSGFDEKAFHWVSSIWLLEGLGVALGS